ncbi:MAG: cytochrome c oxidase assembly protein [Alphaproteobacteria bacterium]|nr:cytochrome c oxidase assembly protein [Alphaproteobacteria bacterium]
MRKLDRNDRVLLSCVTLVAAMVGLTYASAPLYRIFCAATGFDGTPKLFSAPSATTAATTIQVRFDANIAPELPWEFRSEKVSTEVRLGENTVDFYRARNAGEKPLVGIAKFNVTPLKAAKYFNKIKCFCEDGQELKPGQIARFGVAYFIDPAIATDPETKDVTAVTLSYTFFLSKIETKTVAQASVAN